MAQGKKIKQARGERVSVRERERDEGGSHAELIYKLQ